ncbi:hypothetical protein QEN58_10210 [Halomonas alkaliantarctica]|uniref:Cytochrome oxidase Cu insertion factor (SCO1/SenC/PrrC family) n=1 Tax=Halomonas alkaliantarctica TaxID=232346 RepID=A0ABY8LGY7_9GAMM|nr:hypothetical protein [Halomonas alkaliantarctica]WGI23728.1 hypothetical protein QEN58_10210 [Halomonas alkaliantarctica]
MQDAGYIRRQRLKLILIFVIFAAPMVAAWGMVELRIGIPDRHTAHGNVELELPMLDEWPLTATAVNGQDEWILAFDCAQQCEQRKDEFWRLHRALGREAPRLTRLRIGGDPEPLPGEMTSEWKDLPAWRKANSVWLLDPMGRPALAFEANVATKYVLEDIQHLLKVNPQ